MLEENGGVLQELEEREGIVRGFERKKEGRCGRPRNKEKGMKNNNERKRIMTKLTIIKWLCPQALQGITEKIVLI